MTWNKVSGGRRRAPLVCLVERSVDRCGDLPAASGMSHQSPADSWEEVILIRMHRAAREESVSGKEEKGTTAAQVWFLTRRVLVIKRYSNV